MPPAEHLATPRCCRFPRSKLLAFSRYFTPMLLVGTSNGSLGDRSSKSNGLGVPEACMCVSRWACNPSSRAVEMVLACCTITACCRVELQFSLVSWATQPRLASRMLDFTFILTRLCYKLPFCQPRSTTHVYVRSRIASHHNNTRTTHQHTGMTDVQQRARPINRTSIFLRFACVKPDRAGQNMVRSYSKKQAALSM